MSRDLNDRHRAPLGRLPGQRRRVLALRLAKHLELDDAGPKDSKDGEP